MQEPSRDETAPLRAPPSNVEAEQALLGAILWRNRAFDAVAELLEPEHFAYGVNGRIYAAIRALIERGEVANPVTLKNLFDQDGALADVGGAAYLIRLASSVVTVTNAADYGRTIYDCWLRRELIAQSLDTIERAYSFELDPSGDAKAILESAEQTLYRLGESRSNDGPVPVARASFAHVSDVETAYKAGGKPLGISTGLTDLDNVIGGMQKQELIVLGGRPSMGKSLIAGRIAWNMARAGSPVLIFSLEQAMRLWIARWLASTTNISTDRQYSGRVDDNEWSRLMEADTDLRALPLWIDEAGAVSVGMVRHRARRLARKLGVPLGAVVVDHLGLMRASREAEKEGKTARVSEISRDLKALAKELDTPVLALSQLNRGPENRDDKRPSLADLRDSGTIEQDADVVLFAYRPAYYLERSPPTHKPGESDGSFAEREADHAAEVGRVRHVLELIAAKNRHGSGGTARVFYDGQSCVIADLRGAGE